MAYRQKDSPDNFDLRDDAFQASDHVSGTAQQEALQRLGDGEEAELQQYFGKKSFEAQSDLRLFQHTRQPHNNDTKPTMSQDDHHRSLAGSSSQPLVNNRVDFYEAFGNSDMALLMSAPDAITNWLQQSKSATDEEPHLAYDRGTEHGEIVQDWNEIDSLMQTNHPHPNTQPPPTQSLVKNDAPQSRGLLKTEYQKIGAVLSRPEQTGFKFSCDEDGCDGEIFGRASELRRHYHTFHKKGKDIWCPVASCPRSEAEGNKPYTEARKDKLKEHALKQHGLKLEF